MEGLGVAASVIAVVTIGLKSAKSVYQILCNVKGGPKAVQKLAAATDNLSKLLEQTTSLAQQAKEIVGEHDAKFFEALSPLLSECVEELKLIEGKLSKFPAGPTRQF